LSEKIIANAAIVKIFSATWRERFYAYFWYLYWSKFRLWQNV